MEKPKERITENGIDYILVGDYYIPDLKLPEENRPIGRYGRLHREYLKQEHPARYTVILPIAGMVLTFVMTYELIQMLVDHNNLHNFDTWIFFKWIFKTFAAVLVQGIATGGDLTGGHLDLRMVYGAVVLRPLQDREPLEIHMGRSLKYCCKICC